MNILDWLSVIGTLVTLNAFILGWIWNYSSNRTASKHNKDMFYAWAKQMIEMRKMEIEKIEVELQLQLLVLQPMHDKEIVIETLPTSNVMIGHHHSFSSYHLYNWYRWGKIEQKPIPPIVLGSDDAGIFATNIFNEYCNHRILTLHRLDS